MAEEFCLKWNDHQTTLISLFENLFDTQKHVDCILTSEQKVIKAHKVVLSACSPYLAMLISELEGNQVPVLILSHIKFEILQAMVDYMYKGEVSITQEQLESFLEVAKQIQLRGVADMADRIFDSGGGQKRKISASPSPASEPKKKPRRPVPPDQSDSMHDSGMSNDATVPQNRASQRPGDRELSSKPSERVIAKSEDAELIEPKTEPTDEDYEDPVDYLTIEDDEYADESYMNQAGPSNGSQGYENNSKYNLGGDGDPFDSMNHSDDQPSVPQGMSTEEFLALMNNPMEAVEYDKVDPEIRKSLGALRGRGRGTKRGYGKGASQGSEQGPKRSKRGTRGKRGAMRGYPPAVGFQEPQREVSILPVGRSRGRPPLHPASQEPVTIQKVSFHKSHAEPSPKKQSPSKGKGRKSPKKEPAQAPTTPKKGPAPPPPQTPPQPPQGAEKDFVKHFLVNNPNVTLQVKPRPGTSGSQNLPQPPLPTPPPPATPSSSSTQPEIKEEPRDDCDDELIVPKQEPPSPSMDEDLHRKRRDMTFRLEAMEDYFDPGSLMYVCDACGKLYKKSVVLLRHLQLECREAEEFPCSFCPLKTESRKLLMEHMNIEHEDDEDDDEEDYNQ